MLHDSAERFSVAKLHGKRAGYLHINGDKRNIMLYALLHYLVDNGVIVHRKRNDDHCVEHVVIYQLIHGSAADIRRGVHVHILEALEHQHFVTSGLFKMFRDGVDYRLG